MIELIKQKLEPFKNQEVAVSKRKNEKFTLRDLNNKGNLEYDFVSKMKASNVHLAGDSSLVLNVIFDNGEFILPENNNVFFVDESTMLVKKEVEDGFENYFIVLVSSLWQTQIKLKSPSESRSLFARSKSENSEDVILEAEKTKEQVIDLYCKRVSQKYASNINANLLGILTNVTEALKNIDNREILKEEIADIAFLLFDICGKQDINLGAEIEKRLKK